MLWPWLNVICIWGKFGLSDIKLGLYIRVIYLVFRFLIYINRLNMLENEENIYYKSFKSFEVDSYNYVI